MKILISLARFMLGGTETYSVTVGEQLERLGHTVTLQASEASAVGTELAASRQLPLIIGDSDLPDDLDATLVQDAANAYMLAALRPGLRQVFAIHGLSGYEHPPSGLDPAPPVVVFNDRIAGHAAALASQPRVVRMHQPIDLERFRPRGARTGRARTVLTLSNYLGGEQLAVLEDACRDLGLELVRLGASGSPTIDPREAMARADIVIGYGRSVLEGMAMGCAGYVWDYGGGDGWVTAESYPLFEGDGFAGSATETVIDADRLRADLAGYRPELGTLGYDLVRFNHSAATHSEELVGLLGEADPPAAEDAFEERARLVRLEARAAIRVDGMEAENRRMGEDLATMVADRDEARALLGQIMNSRSWRLAAPLRRAAALLRRQR
ncbi:MAG TPA: hypothetical protein VH476_08095 [Solirubrobacterales bacterium]|jgi:hypothetical protein